MKVFIAKLGDSATNSYIPEEDNHKQKDGEVNNVIGNTSPKSLKNNWMEKTRNRSNPSIQINVAFLIMFFIEFVILFLTLFTNGYLRSLSSNLSIPSSNRYFLTILQNWELLLTIDLCINMFLIKPFQNAPESTSVYLWKDYFYNFESREPLEQFFKIFMYRVLIYIIMAWLFVQTPTLYITLITSILVAINIIVVALLVIYAIIFFFKLLLAYIIDDYMAQGESFKLITSIRPNIAKSRDMTLKEIDKLISAINNPNQLKFGEYTLPKLYRSKIAYTLSYIRQKIDVLQIGSKERELNEYKSAEKELATKLYEDLRKDKCIICYKQLDSVSPTQLVACPRCGSGGHKEHIKDWFDTGKDFCPVCRARVGKEQFLLLNIVSI